VTDDHDGVPGGIQLPAAGTAWRARPVPTSPASGRGGERRTPDPAASSRRIMRQVAVARKLRRQRLTLAVAGTMSALTLLVSGSAWMLTSYLSTRVGRLNAGISGTPLSGPVNILVAGVDNRGGLTRRQEIRLHVGHTISANSDTLMLVHIPADHASAQVVSLPRDSWVNIPGYGLNKINAAFGLGGARLMVATVERATGMAVNDYVEISFLGFVKVINALGGVNICLPYGIDDPASGLHMTAGKHHVDGVTALKFARDRHSFALSDLARIRDQQQLLSSLFAEATQAGIIADPARLQRFLSSVTAAVKVDRGFDLVRVAQELRGIRPSAVTFTTVPLASLNYVTPTGESAVLWDRARAAALFSSLKSGGSGTALSRPGHRARRLARARARATAARLGRTAAQDACR
jgi:LCP family protein required for cell wall assembly